MIVHKNHEVASSNRDEDDHGEFLYNNLKTVALHRKVFFDDVDEKLVVVTAEISYPE